MNAIPENLTSTSASDECDQVLNSLLLRWPEEPSDVLSSALLYHLCHCRSCLRTWIALEAAADLAGFSESQGNSSASLDDVDIVPPTSRIPTHVVWAPAP